MKKRLLICLIILLFPICLYAKPVSYTRTEEMLRVPGDVEVTAENKERILKTPSIDANAKIYDFADLLTEDEKSKIYNQASDFINNTGLDIAIVTLDELNGKTISEYAYDFYDYNDFKDRGVTFFINVSGPKTSIYMSTNGASGTEARVAYPDNVISKILEYVYEKKIQKKDYFGACQMFIKLTDGFFYEKYGDQKVGEMDLEVKGPFPFTEISIISVILTFIIVGLVITKYQKTTRHVDMTVKKAINETSMIVKCEYDKPIKS